MTEEEQNKNVLVDKVELAKLLDRVDRLESTADVGRLGRYDARFFKKGPNVFSLSVYNGKIITSWRTLKDVAYKDPRTGMIVEDQQYEILFSNNTKLKVQGYEQFSDMRYKERVRAEEISRTTDDMGITITVKIIDTGSKFYGEELAIGAQFLN